MIREQQMKEKVITLYQQIQLGNHNDWEEEEDPLILLMLNKMISEDMQLESQKNALDIWKQIDLIQKCKVEEIKTSQALDILKEIGNQMQDYKNFNEKNLEQKENVQQNFDLDFSEKLKQMILRNFLKAYGKLVQYQKPNIDQGIQTLDVALETKSSNFASVIKKALNQQHSKKSPVKHQVEAPMQHSPLYKQYLDSQNLNFKYEEKIALMEEDI